MLQPLIEVPLLNVLYRVTDILFKENLNLKDSLLFGIQAPSAAVFEMRRGRFGCCKIQTLSDLGFLFS